MPRPLLVHLLIHPPSLVMRSLGVDRTWSSPNHPTTKRPPPAPPSPPLPPPAVPGGRNPADGGLTGRGPPPRVQQHDLSAAGRRGGSGGECFELSKEMFYSTRAPRRAWRWVLGCLELFVKNTFNAGRRGGALRWVLRAFQLYRYHTAMRFNAGNFTFSTAELKDLRSFTLTQDTAGNFTFGTAEL